MTAVKDLILERIKDYERELENADSNDFLSIQLIEADLEKLARNLEFAELEEKSHDFSHK
ncbi:MAG: hypothetical protein V4438_02420 [Patescibacteria group bacterium]